MGAFDTPASGLCHRTPILAGAANGEIHPSTQMMYLDPHVMQTFFKTKNSRTASEVFTDKISFMNWLRSTNFTFETQNPTYKILSRDFHEKLSEALMIQSKILKKWLEEFVQTLVR